VATVTISGAGNPYDASTGYITYTVNPSSSYTTTIDKFATGDKIVCAGSTTTITNTNGVDGLVVVKCNSTTNTVIINLTNVIPPSADGQIFNVGSFNTVFGTGSLVVQ